MKVQAVGNIAARVAAVLLFALALYIGMLGLSGQASAGVPVGIPIGLGSTVGKVERAVLDDTANGKSASFIILMSDQANVTPAYAMRDQDARGWYVYNTLKAQADKSQAGLRAMLRAQGVSYQSFWIVNALVVTGNRALVDAVAARADVGKIEANRPFKGISDPVDARNAIPMNDA